METRHEVVTPIVATQAAPTEAKRPARRRPTPPQVVVSDTDEDNEDHICRGENLRPAAPSTDPTSGFPTRSSAERVESLDARR